VLGVVIFLSWAFSIDENSNRLHYTWGNRERGQPCAIRKLEENVRPPTSASTTLPTWNLMSFLKNYSGVTSIPELYSVSLSVVSRANAP
jgi:hypothetical protein